MHKNQSIDVENSINSGQVFLWKKDNHFWYGINGQNVLKVDGLGNIKSYQNTKADFFRKRDDMVKIIKSISVDNETKNAVRKYPGLR